MTGPTSGEPDEHEAPGQLFVGVFWGAVFFAGCAAAALLLWPLG
jgi:hypothetical protein